MKSEKPIWVLASASLMTFSTPAYAGEGDVETAPPEGVEAEADEEAVLESGDYAASVELKGSLQDQANRVFTKADFERFAPRTALDMVSRIPGFSISGGNGGGQRGLGQASQNILLNGQRVSAKSNDAATTLSRIDADDVIRIEVVDGATLDIPGLTGEVANILYRASEMGGTFEWTPQFRKRVGHSILVGELALNGRKGNTEWNASITADRRFQGHWGPETVFDPDGDILLRRDEFGRYPQNRSGVAASLAREADNGNKLNLNASAGLRHFANRIEGDVFDGTDLFLGSEVADNDFNGYDLELGGDYEFALASGRLKLIGLQRFESRPGENRFTNLDGDVSEFIVDRLGRESVVRSEYRWGDKADWQVSLEGALNTLDSEAELLFTPVGGSVIDIPVPGANATIKEKRAEAILSYGRPIAEGLTLQLNLGGEYSRISVDGDAGSGARTYWRPKGSVSLAWRASPSLAVNAEVERRVDQLSFFDFLAAVDIANDTNRATNISLVPSQRWRGRIEATKTFEGIGAINPFFEFAFIEDKIEIVPISSTEEALGNVDSASAFWAGVQGTLELNKLGWKGARLGFNASAQKTYIDDPLLGDERDISQVLDYFVSANIRHDIPETNWAWGVEVNRNRMTPFYRLDQVSFRYNTGVQGNVFVENKDVAGLTIRAAVINLFDSKDGFWRDVYADRRDGPLAFREEQLREYGRIFQLSVKGNI
ncbi:TonB-dependent receptor plug domain-containing protein [Sphingomicrobium clamense]|uniref:TonB-dependent receptor n=1 Tax=Sphingomicrobium clamense TaxID=2851013 RepID=A0ABS6V2U4_9SPHN|nr:TonB-dependent receptor plug domain-containing protein [Sphingomicrobium sp. B8]MBW0143883.1 TonB-dependent receptor [Sphingomicrobium sp. B8]